MAKRQKLFYAGHIIRQKLETLDFTFFEVADGWKLSNKRINSSVYVYKLKVKRTLLRENGDLELSTKEIQDFCLRREIDEFKSHGLPPRGTSCFAAMTKAMDKRAHKRVMRAYNAFTFRNQPFRSDKGVYFCKKPFDMLKNKKAKVRFWESDIPGIGHQLCSLGGKVIAK